MEEIRTLLTGMTGETTQTTTASGPQQEFDSWIAESNQGFLSLCSERYAPEVNPYRYGTITVAYWVMGEAAPLSLKHLLRVLKEVEGSETGWPPWWCPTHDPIRPRPQHDSVECWMMENKYPNDPGHIDFWRASPARKLFLLRGFDEDGGADFEPGTVFDLTLPMWHVGECLLHAQRFGEALGHIEREVIFKVAWTGLAGRQLKAWASKGRRDSGRRRTAHQDSVSSQIIVPAGTISPGLVEYVNDLTRPLYNLFDFYEPPKQIYIEELKKMQRGI